MALDLYKNFVQNFVSAQYLETELIEFDQRVRALRGYFGPSVRSNNKSCSSLVSLYKFIRSIAKV